MPSSNALSTTSSPRRGALRAHRAVAEALEELCGERPDARVGELAYHWMHATQAQIATKAIDYSQQAGDHALAQLAPEEAARWYHDALDLCERAPECGTGTRAALLARLGDAQRQSGDPDHRDTLLRAARLAADVNDTDTLVRAALANNRGFMSLIGAVDDERVDVLRLAIDRLGNNDTARRAQLLATLCSELAFAAEGFEERLALAEEAVVVARQSGDPIVLADVVVRIFSSISAPETRELRAAWITEACLLVDDLHPTQQFLAFVYRAIAALDSGDGRTWREALAVAQSVAQHTGQPSHRWQILFGCVVDEIVGGDLVAAERTAGDALAAGLDLYPHDAIIVYGAAMLVIGLFQTRGPEMLPLVEELRHTNPGFVVFDAVASANAAESGDIERATRILDAAVTNGLAVPRDAAWLITNWIWALAAADTQHRPAAEILFSRLTSWADHHATNGFVYTGSIAHILAMLAVVLGRPADANAYFAQALEAHTNAGARAFIVWTKALWGRFLIDQSNPDDRLRGQMLVGEALSVAASDGYPLIERAARASDDNKPA